MYLASLPAVVVLPEPCKPTSIKTVGLLVLYLISDCSLPKRTTNSSWTILTKVCPGLSLAKTSWPTAFSLIWARNSLTTLKFTSASSKATRISLSISSMLASVRRDCPLIFLRMFWNRSVKDSNAIGFPFLEIQTEVKQTFQLYRRQNPGSIKTLG